MSREREVRERERERESVEVSRFIGVEFFSRPRQRCVAAKIECKSKKKKKKKKKKKTTPPPTPIRAYLLVLVHFVVRRSPELERRAGVGLSK